MTAADSRGSFWIGILLQLLIASTLPLVSTAAPPASEPGPTGTLADWKNGFRIRPLLEDDCHSIHAYYLTSPESPDGSSVIFYRSRVPDAQTGDVCLLDRQTGQQVVIATEVGVEDAHRAACQQWAADGKRVVFHRFLPNGSTRVEVFDPQNGTCTPVADEWLVGFGQPDSELMPLYGPHWNPGEHRHLEMLNVLTLERTPSRLTSESMLKAFPDWCRETFGEVKPSIFFPVLSPDHQQVFFKGSAPQIPDPYSWKASRRVGLFVFDLARGEFVLFRPYWGHPSWSPDSESVMERDGMLYDIGTGTNRGLPNFPKLHGHPHPTLSRNGELFVTDAYATSEPAADGKREWIVLVGDARTGETVQIRQFDNSGGATSWRPAHPHPVFSSDLRRIYFNVNDGKWTRIYVAECIPKDSAE
ncbi:TolB family protein [Planctomicrobium sp. SH664]|uniref:TolB family protein n=1 Tax=Planctomicrobium sp. SH664 TaxID=3448125 RepID=UPI003F5CADBE